jgi:5-methylcytosine-specific restriction endonuclease McrA
MRGYEDSLRGYGHETHLKNNFTCQYCGYDGRSFPNWFQLSIDHIVPMSQGGEDNENNKITVCQACNSITSRMTFPEGMPKDEIIAKKRKRVRDRREDYFEFWQNHVAPQYIQHRKDSVCSKETRPY